ncbi:hypothetical protein FK529_04890 [Tsukamurella asaccharolytica]|uniref:Uncharacterized protein n=1 Tax=Tsukamurella asaccharolytica TaxID=2592067 RepID=A0A5C5RCP4_9ACTN|nr:hypothetical protein [Tsukamurella asaccharolytica]TWS20680.1 hypothetical protein FK529_04890 [Tsukamurella asaccharolytica]
MRWKTASAPALMAVVLTLYGCSTVAGTAVPDPSAAPALDTGNFVTKPRTVEARTPADAWQQEGWRLADGIPAPWDVDSSLTVRVPDLITTPLVSASQLGLESNLSPFGTKQQKIVDAAPFKTAMFAGAQNKEGTRVLRMGLMRFASAEAATSLVGQLTNGAEVQAGTPREVNADGWRFVTVGKRNTKNAASMTIIAPRGDLIAVVTVDFPVGLGDAEGKVVGELGKRAREMLWTKMRDYKPSDAPNGIKPKVDMDFDGLMSLTLPKTIPTNELGLSEGVDWGDGWMTIATYGLMTSNPEYVRRFDLDYVAKTRASVVFRARTEASATEFFRVDHAVDGQTPTLVDLKGISRDNGKCWQSGTNIVCSVRAGRYVSIVLSSTRALAEQSASASYKIMQQARVK